MARSLTRHPLTPQPLPRAAGLSGSPAVLEAAPLDTLAPAPTAPLPSLACAPWQTVVVLQLLRASFMEAQEVKQLDHVFTHVSVAANTLPPPRAGRVCWLREENNVPSLCHFRMLPLGLSQCDRAPWLRQRARWLGHGMA